MNFNRKLNFNQIRVVLDPSINPKWKLRSWRGKKNQNQKKTSLSVKSSPICKLDILGKHSWMRRHCHTHLGSNISYDNQNGPKRTAHLHMNRQPFGSWSALGLGFSYFSHVFFFNVGTGHWVAVLLLVFEESSNGLCQHVVFIFIYVEIGDFEFEYFEKSCCHKSSCRVNLYHQDWVIYQHKEVFVLSFKIWKLE